VIAYQVSKSQTWDHREMCLGIRRSHFASVATTFPIGAAMWIYRREATLRPGRRLVQVIDPCGGWGDRLAAALLSGPRFLENFTSMDPWHISRQLSHRVRDTLGRETRINIDIQDWSAADESRPWPSADLVFTSPPYAKQECYNIETTDEDDSQAWRLCDLGKFKSDFLEPLFRNAAKATRLYNGRVVINIQDTKSGYKGQNLVKDTLDAARLAGLVHVETLGIRMNGSGRSTIVMPDGNAVKSAAPVFIFAHPTPSK
jgi:hypothetical protein